MNVTRPLSVSRRVSALPMSCSSAAKRSAWPRVRSSPSGSSSTRAQRGSVVGEVLGQMRVDLAEASAAPRSCGRRRRGGGSGSARCRAGARARAAPPRARRARTPARRPSAARGARTMRRSSAKTRSPAASVMRGAHSRVAVAVAGVRLEAELGREADQAQRAQAVALVGVRRDHAQQRALRGRAAPSNGSIRRPPNSGSAIALTVKSRCARSSSMPSPCSGVMSISQPSPTTRHAPNCSDSGNAGTPAAFAIARAASAACAGDREVEVGERRRRRAARRGSRRRRSSAVLARERARARRARGCWRPRRSSSVACGVHAELQCAAHARRQAARDLVVDRADALRELLDRDALACPASPISTAGAPGVHVGVGSEVDRDVVHADGADERVAPPADQDLGVVRERAAPAVAVADRERADPGRLGRLPAAAVAGAVARLEAADRGDVRARG